MTGLVTVIGVAGPELSTEARTALDAARLVVGGARHLAALPIPVSARRIALGPLAAALEAVVADEGPAVVLASGDPGFFGIVRALRRYGIEPRVIPGVSSVAAAFAAVGLSWEDAVVVSARGSAGGRSLRRAVNVCRAHPKVAILTGPTAQPQELAQGLLIPDNLGVSRTLIITERLFETDQSTTRLTLEQAAARSDWLEPNVVLCLDDAVAQDGADQNGNADQQGSADQKPRPSRQRWHAGPASASGAWTAPESAYEHRDSMITKSEVRALILARLAPGLGDLVWDVGAGSGAVGIECARHGAAVIAVERDADSGERIRANVAAHGVRVALAQGRAPEVLAGLPEPDAVFVGGGGLDTVRAVIARAPRRIVIALAAVERVGECVALLVADGREVDGVLTQSSRLALLPDGAHRFAAQNPVFVLWGVQTAGARPGRPDKKGEST
jgi:precorrin-6B C5,15-methyltransferase / cobalt-precorrin-6B C5,C15-methyltransferase